MGHETLLGRIGGRVHVELSEPTALMTERLYNRKATQAATIGARA
jgi:hypothetical protein